MSKRILVIGESALDIWVRGTCERLSPEAPVVIQRPTQTDTNPGMAGNTKANLETLSPGVAIDFVHQTKAIYKIRHVDEASGQQLLRVDDGDDSIDSTFWERLVAKMAANRDGYVACVISDYGKGLLSENVIEALTAIMHEVGATVWVDTKKVLGAWSRDIDYIKINRKEYNHQLANGVKDPWSYCRNLIVTRGKEGSVLYGQDGSEAYVSPPIMRRIFSLSGAGDTYLAALVSQYLINGGNVRTAMDYANRAAAVAVSKPGVVAVTRDEVEDLTSDS